MIQLALMPLAAVLAAQSTLADSGAFDRWRGAQGVVEQHLDRAHKRRVEKADREKQQRLQAIDRELEQYRRDRFGGGDAEDRHQ